MNNNYNINDWARDQRNAEDAENILAAAFKLRQKFPKTNKVISIIWTVISFFGGIAYGLELDRQPIGIILYGIIFSVIGGLTAYFAGLFILATILILALIGFFIRFL